MHALPKVRKGMVANASGNKGRMAAGSEGGKSLNARTRKAAGMAILVAVMAVYIGALVVIADSVPDHWAAELAFFAIAGVAWALPLRPLLRWINRPDDAGPEGE